MLQKYLRFSLLVLLVAMGSNPASGEDLKTLHGHVPAAVAHLNPTGRVSAMNQMRLAIGLSLRDPAGLAQFLTQLCDPASPNYKRYLTPGEFATHFGPTEQDYEAVKQFARANGLTIKATYSNRLVLDVAGPVAAVEKALHITLRTYEHPTEGRVFFAPDTEPTVDAALPVADISGLSNYRLPHPKLHSMNITAKATSKGGSAPDGASYMGGDFRAAYAPGVTLRGSGQIVGLFEFDGYYPNDITSYESLIGYTNVPLSNVLLDEVSGVPGYSLIPGAGGEVSLDIEMAIAMAPALAGVIVYEGSEQNSILSQMASDDQAMQLSCSWGWGGGPSTTTDALFQEMISQGQSFFNASGDTDAFAAGSANDVDNPGQVNAPSSSPYITQVGGTTLTTGAKEVYTSETVWSGGRSVGSSGGISTYYTNGFYWQSLVNNMAGRGGSTTHRDIPDVAGIANFVWVIYSNGVSGSFEGTSCAAPMWAGFIALANQQAATIGRPPVGFVNPAVYAIGSGANYLACFHDITNGNNTWSGSRNLFYATNGYDLCTGFGTPNGANLIAALNDALVVSPTAGYAFSGPVAGPFNPASGAVQLTNFSPVALNWSLINNAPWLQANSTGGTLPSFATTSVNISPNATAGNLGIGNYTTILAFTNQTSHNFQIIPVTLQVFQPQAVFPGNGFTAVGPVGGPFVSTSQILTLTDLGINTLNWSLVNTSAWLTVSAKSGVLAPGGYATVTAGLSSVASTYTAGLYSTSVVFSNQLGLVAVVPFTLSIAQPIILNGGFETGSFADWTQSGNMSFTSVTNGKANAAYIHSGTYAAQLGAGGTPGYLTQNLTTLPGQSYLLSLWLRNPTGDTPNLFQVQVNGVMLGAQTNITSTSWNNLQFLFTADSTVTPLQFGFQNDQDYFGLDDISVTQLAPVAFTSAVQSSSNFHLVWGTSTGIVYQVQYTTNLVDADWINVGGATTANTATLSLIDTNALHISPKRFYRVLAMP